MTEDIKYSELFFLNMKIIIHIKVSKISKFENQLIRTPMYGPQLLWQR